MTVDTSGATGRKTAFKPSGNALADAARKLQGLQHMMRFAPKTEEEFNRRLDAIRSECEGLRQETGGQNRMETGGENRMEPPELEQKGEEGEE